MGVRNRYTVRGLGISVVPKAGKNRKKITLKNESSTNEALIHLFFYWDMHSFHLSTFL